MNQNPGRNDPCPCGSGKKYKKCCGMKKKLSARKANVISSTSKGSLLDRISAGGVFTASSQEKPNSLKNRIAKTSDDENPKKSD